MNDACDRMIAHSFLKFDRVKNVSTDNNDVAFCAVGRLKVIGHRLVLSVLTQSIYDMGANEP